MGGTVGGAALAIGTIVTIVTMHYRRRRKFFFPVDLSASSMAADNPEPYDATAEQFPTQRRTTFLPLAGAPNSYVTKELRQPLRHGPRLEEAYSQTITPPPLEDESQLQREDLVARESTARISMSVGALQRLLRRAEGGWADPQRTQGFDDGFVGTAPPRYEDVAGS